MRRAHGLLWISLLALIVAVGCGDRRRGRRHDGGLDAALVDAAEEAGWPDAGGDGGADAALDGGAMDSGRADAGPRDAGLPDVGIVDAGGGCPSGLAAWYRFESTTGPVVDECGRHDGVVEGSGTVRGEAGRSGLAIRFTGGDGRVRVPASVDLDFITAGTIELWVRVDDRASVGCTVSRGTGSSDDNVLQNTSCLNMQTIYSRSAVGTTNATTPCDTLPLAAWAHVAVVNDGVEVRAYVNGVLSTSSPGGYLGPLTTDLYMGRRPQGVFPLRGALDEIKWWTVARSQAHICADAGGSWSGSSCSL